jgi:hypothetical protein
MSQRSAFFDMNRRPAQGMDNNPILNVNFRPDNYHLDLALGTRLICSDHGIWPDKTLSPISTYPITTADG